MRDHHEHFPADERLTAFALGELPPAEAAELAAVVAASDSARQEVAETRELAALLSEALAREAAAVPVPPLPEFADSVGGVDEPAVEDARVVEVPAWRFRWVLPWEAVAALLVVLAGAWWFGTARDRAERALELARLSEVRDLAVALPPPAGELVTVVSDPTPTAAVVAAGAGALPAGESSGVAISPASRLPAAPVDRMSVARTVAPESVVPVAPLVSPAAGPAPAMSVELMRRDGLAPARPGSAGPRIENPGQVATSGLDPGMSPTLASRYGLSPSPAVPRAASAPARSLSSGAVGQDGYRGRANLAERRLGEQEMTRPVDRLGRLSTSVDGGEVRFWEVERRGENREGANPGYLDAGENAFVPVASQPLSTFGLDVDTGSYANVRRFLRAGMFPPRESVRVEEMINYFQYRHPDPRGDDVFGIQTEVAPCPWEPRHRLVWVALKARGLGGERPPGNLVFLVDVSGSMQPAERLPLLKQGLRALVKRLSAVDRVAIVTYSSSAGVRLPSTSCEEKDRILEAIDSLEAGGSTNGEGGIRQAYELARRHLIPGGVNRVLLCTDGDFNVGISDQDQLVSLVAGEARSGVFLTTLGVGTDNFKDALMRRLADRGNGSYHYLDSSEEAQRVLLEQMDATFVTVARDAKAQVEFNPARVAAWRLIGYEKRLMAAQDFNDDTKDAGEVGAGQTVTVLYEIVPAGGRVPGAVDPLKYQPAPAAEVARVRVGAGAGAASRELLTLKLRYQRPEGSASVLKEVAVQDREQVWSGDFRFATAVAAFGMALRDPSWDGGRGFDRALELAQPALGDDPGGWRAEFLTLVRKARGMPRR